MGSPRIPGGSRPVTVTEITGRGEDVHELLFGPGSTGRPVLSDAGIPANTGAAVTAAADTMRVTGGPGSVRVSTPALEALRHRLDRLTENLDAVLLGLLPADTELGAWTLTGHHALAAAAVSAARVRLELTVCKGALEHTSAALLAAGQRYAAVDGSVAGLFGPAPLAGPLQHLPAPTVREVTRTLDELGVALARAQVRSPGDLADSVRVTAFGLVVEGGGPEGTNAVIRGVGLDDILDPLLAVPLPSVPLWGPGGPRDPGGSPAREYTVGEYARERVSRTLRNYGEFEARGGAAAAGARWPGAAAVSAALGALPPPARATVTVALGRSGHPAGNAAVTLTPVERLLYPLAGPRALRPVSKETFTGITAANAGRFHIRPLRERPLPDGVTFDGSVPVTVAGTAAALKDAKNIVHGRDGSGRPVENSTVMVQKATDASGRRGYSVVLTGTERWVDGPGVHDLRGIADAMAVTPGGRLMDLTPAQRMALEALEDAGIRPGDPVVLTGHSLGGIDAAGLAANEEFRRLYPVAAVTIFGAPVGGFTIPGSTSVMSVEHVDDVVPALDAVPNPDSGTRTTVRVNTPYGSRESARDKLSGVEAHDMYVYTLGAQGIGTSGHPAVAQHEQRLAAAIPHGPQARTETYVYHGREEHAAPPSR